jgi:hypothetical protein
LFVTQTNEVTQLLPVSMYAAMDTQLQKKAFNFIDASVSELRNTKSLSRDQVLKIASEQNLNVEKFTKALDGDYSELLSQQAHYAQSLGLSSPHVITNGRVTSMALP